MGLKNGEEQSSMVSSFLPHQGAAESQRLRLLIYVLFYTVFANIPYWTASREFGFMQLGWFCVEYALLGLLALFIAPVWAACLLFLLTAVDILCGICRSYYLTIEGCFYGRNLFHSMPDSRLYATLAVLLLALLTAGGAAILQTDEMTVRTRARAGVCLVAFCCLIAVAEIVTAVRTTGHIPKLIAAPDKIDTSRSATARLERIPILRLLRIEYTEAKIRATEKTPTDTVSPVLNATDLALSSAGIGSAKPREELPNLVIVLVESWGLSSNQAMNVALTHPYFTPAILARYTVQQGSVPFYGGTIAGEARELCGNSMGYRLLNSTADKLKGCLPDRLGMLGYETVALHGMDGNMFDRSNWWRTIGFQQRWFHDQFKQQALPDCAGAFIGTCDAAIAGWIGQRIERPDANPEFIHWMTLGSHLPLPVPSGVPSADECLASLSLRPGSALCSWYQLIDNVHSSVSQVALGKLARPTIFVVVGDHAPPFGDDAMRRSFSRSVVPYILLLPREGNASGLK